MVDCPVEPGPGARVPPQLWYNTGMKPTAKSVLVAPFLALVQQKKPLIHHITNWVTIADCAQVVKSLGASPVMAHAPEEVADMAKLASAVVLNIGTLTHKMVESMKLAARAANQRKIPVIFDVCGAGATPFRDRMCLSLLAEVRIDVIKGNASEVARIAGLDVHTHGVDAGEVGQDLAQVAGKLAFDRSCTVVITGREDYVASRNELYVVGNGHEMMTRVVGTGCMAASVIGTFCGSSPQDLAAAAAAGLACFGIAAELAAGEAAGPLHFKQLLLDRLAGLDEKTVTARQRVTAR